MHLPGTLSLVVPSPMIQLPFVGRHSLTLAAIPRPDRPLEPGRSGGQDLAVKKQIDKWQATSLGFLTNEIQRRHLRKTTYSVTFCLPHRRHGLPKLLTRELLFWGVVALWLRLVQWPRSFQWFRFVRPPHPFSTLIDLIRL